MAVIREVIETIDFWSPPLKKHRYQMSSIQRKAFISSGEGSGILIEELRERDRIASGILEAKQREPAGEDQGFESAPAGVLAPDDAALAAMPDKAEGEAKPQGRRFRAIRRIEEIIYDDTLVQQGRLEEEAYETLNSDGFYDEVLPVDYDEDIVEKPPIEYKEVLLLVAAFIVLVGISVFVVMKFVL